MSVRKVQSLPVEMAGCSQRKTGENGVTTAVAAREWRIHFSKIYVIGIGPGAYDQNDRKSDPRHE